MANPINHNSPINDQNIIVQLGYDKGGRVLNQRDPRGNLTTYEYDQLDRRTKRTNPLSTQWLTLYENVSGGGIRTTLTYPGVNGGSSYTIQRDFDRLGRPTSINYGDAATTPTVNFTYDSIGDRTKMSEFGTSGKIRETTFTYDEAHRMDSAGFDNDGNNTVDQTVSYTYDVSGLRTKLTLPDNKTVTYSYDEKGALASLTDDWSGSSKTTRLTSNAIGQVLGIQRPGIGGADDSQLGSDYQYDAAGRVKQIRHTRTSIAGLNTVAQYDYLVDGLGNRTRAQEQWLPGGSGTLTQQTITYSYDKLARVLTGKYYAGLVTPTGSDSIVREYDYTYDLAGNRLSEVENIGGSATTASYTYNNANQLTGDGTYTYNYDNNGNLINKKQGATTLETYVWDRANRLKTFGSNSYQYDGDSHRIQQTVSSNVTDYVLDLQTSLPTILTETTGANVLRYIHSPHGVHMHQDASGNRAWYLTDGLGSVRGISSQTRQYTPYGKPFDVIGTSQTPYGFTGEPTDSNGLVYLRARYYHPHLAVFPSLDPFEGTEARPMSLNGYSYVEGNPVNFTDPSGEVILLDDAAIFIGGLLFGALLLAAAALNYINQQNPNLGQDIADFGQNVGKELDDFWNKACVPALEAAADAMSNSYAGSCSPAGCDTVPFYDMWTESQTNTQTQTQSQTNVKEEVHNDPCTYEEMERRIAGRSIGQIVGDVGNIRLGEPGLYKGTTPAGRKSVIGKAIDICKTGNTDESEYYKCMPGVNCPDRILSDGNSAFVARRLMGQSLAEIELHLHPSDSPFGIFYEQEEVNYYYSPEYDWATAKWHD